MALGSKTAGIFSGLAVGTAAGVFLAATNPILPRTDTTQVAEAPLRDALRKRVLVAPDGEFEVHLKLEQAVGARDALSKAIYTRILRDYFA